MMRDIDKNNKTYVKSCYDKYDKIRDSKHERHRRLDEGQKLKTSHQSKTQIRSTKRARDEYDDTDERKRRRYDDKYCRKHEEYVTNCNIFKSDFNTISDRKRKSHSKRTKSGYKKGSKSAATNSDNDGSTSQETDDKKLLESLRLKRSHLIAELASQENDTQDSISVSISNSIGIPEEINITFEPPSDNSLNKNKDAETEDEKANGDCLDMFADNFNHDVAANPTQLQGTLAENHKLNDNWDDVEGYYNVRLGEVIGGRYTVFNLTGKGVFSNVVKARDTLENDVEVAIKLIRNNDMMYRAGLKEVDFLKKINELDKHDKYHCVRLLRSLMHKNHLCLVFECLDMNLREVLKKYGRNVGLNIAAIRSYGQQLLLALKLTQKAEVIHGDVKPDNILVNENKTVLKLSDFGSAICVQDNDVAEYMVSRFYRAPEVILGLRYDCAIDLWAVGVTLYELYTGQIMFPGKDNNDMLRLMMEAKGRFPNKMVKRAQFKDKYFDDQFNFLQKEVDRITEMVKVKMVRAGQPRALSIDLFIRSKQVEDDDHKVKQFRDFLDRILQLDPTKRMSINESLNHPFITESSKK